MKQSLPPAGAAVIEARLNPTMVEIMDSLTLRCCSEYSGESFGFTDKSLLLLRFDGEDPESLEKRVLRAGEICVESGSSEVLAAENPAEQRRLWKLRSATHEAICAKAGSVCEEDVVVPVAAAGALISKAQELAGKYKLPAAVFGHLGDGNLHINFTRCGAAAPLEETVLKLKDEIFAAAASLGGKISGEHGIGITKKKWMRRYADPGYLSLLMEIKKTMDPSNILNPGKIFD